MHLPACRIPNTQIVFPAEQSMGAWNRVLFMGIDQQDMETVALALARGAAVNTYSHFEEISSEATGCYSLVRGGMTPLHQACLLSGNEATDPGNVLRIVQCLLEAGGNPNACVHELQGNEGPRLSVLDAASMSEEVFAPEMCKMLCAHGAKPTGLTVSLAIMQNPHFEALTNLYFSVVPRQQQVQLLDHHPLDELAVIPIGNETQIERMACLVRHGAGLDKRAKGHKLTPAQSIMMANPGRGADVIEQLRSITSLPLVRLAAARMTSPR